MGVGNWFPAVADSHGWDKPEFYEMIYVDYADGVETAEPEHYRTLEHLFYNHVLRLLPKSYQRVYRRAGHYEWEREWGQAGGIILAENGLLMCCARSLEVSGECALYFLVKRNEDNERVWPLAERQIQPVAYTLFDKLFHGTPDTPAYGKAIRVRDTGYTSRPYVPTGRYAPTVAS